MINCTLRMNFEPGLREEALHVLRSLKGPVRSHPGCTQTLLMSDVHNDAIVTWISRWRTRSDLDHHVTSGHFRRILAVMELAAEAPEIEFDIGTELRSLDLIDEIIGGGNNKQALHSNKQNPDRIEGGIEK